MKRKKLIILSNDTRILGDILNVHVELMFFRLTSHLAPTVALVLFLVLIVILLWWWMVSSVHLILMIVMMKSALVAFHQVAGNILRWSVAQRRVAQVH